MSRRPQIKLPERPIRNNEIHYAGFDLSLTGTGLVIMNHKGLVKERHVISVKERGAERLHKIQQKIDKLITPYNLKLVCIEGYAMGAKCGHTFGIGELGGVIRLLLYNKGIPYKEPTPGQLKQFATGHGGGEKGSKDQVTLHLYKCFGFEAVNNDEADAAVLCIISRAIDGHVINLNVHQKKVVHTILNPPEKKKKKNETKTL